MKQIEDTVDLFITDKLEVISDKQRGKYIRMEPSHSVPPEHTDKQITTIFPDKSIDTSKQEQYPCRMRVDEYITGDNKRTGYLIISEFIYDKTHYIQVIDWNGKEYIKHNWEDVGPCQNI